MLKSELQLTGIVNNDFSDVVLNRFACRELDPDFKVSREEIGDILNQAAMATASGVNTQPWFFLVVDTDEGKQKLDEVMRIGDKDRTTRCSFALVPFADRSWVEDFDEMWELESKIEPMVNPGFMDEMVKQMMKGATFAWYDEMVEGDGKYLERSISFQAGLLVSNIMNVCRAHGLDTGFMDSWDPQLLPEFFGIDIERYAPMGVLAVGKSLGSLTEKYRRPLDEIVAWA